MIFGEHRFGADMKVTPGQIGGGTELLIVEIEAHHQSGISVGGWEALDRSDVERLRDLCVEALR